MIKKLLIIIFVVLSTSLILAHSGYGTDDQGNPNDPHTNDRANACYNKGDWCHTTDADGDGDVDEQDVDWLYTCGWYLIRAEHDIFPVDEYFPGCEHVLPLPEIIPVDNTNWITCYDEIDAGYDIYRYEDGNDTNRESLGFSDTPQGDYCPWIPR